MNDFLERPLKEGDDVIFVRCGSSDFYPGKIIGFIKDQAKIEWWYKWETATTRITKKISKFIIKI